MTRQKKVNFWTEFGTIEDNLVAHKRMHRGIRNRSLVQCALQALVHHMTCKSTSAWERCAHNSWTWRFTRVFVWRRIPRWARPFPRPGGRARNHSGGRVRRSRHGCSGQGGPVSIRWASDFWADLHEIWDILRFENEIIWLRRGKKLSLTGRSWRWRRCSCRWRTWHPWSTSLATARDFRMTS